MNLIVALFALFMIGIGIYGLAWPQRLATFIALLRSERALWTAAVLRVLFACALWLAAPASKAPLALGILAGVVLAAGVALPLLGLARLVAILDWWLERPAALQRAWLAMPVVLGSFFLWAVAGKSSGNPFAASPCRRRGGKGNGGYSPAFRNACMPRCSAPEGRGLPRSFTQAARSSKTWSACRSRNSMW